MKRETTTSKALENNINKTDNNEDLRQSEALKPIINAANSEPSIDFDYDKFMKELKSSHQKLTELNEALQNKKKSTGILDSGNICFPYFILFLI